MAFSLHNDNCKLIYKGKNNYKRDDKMKKLYRYFKFHMKTAYKNIIRHLGLTFSASFAVAITLILISVFMLIASNLTNFTYHIEQQVTIRASIDNIVKAKEKTELEKQIKAMPEVKNVTLSTGKEELESYKKEYAEDEGLFSMYEGKTSPIRDTFIIEAKQGKDIKALSEKIGKIKGIATSEFGGESTSNMIKSLKSIRDGGMVFIIFLVLIAVFLISNKIKMSIYTRKNEIAIMRFVGASNWCIKFPMMLEGIVIGLLGSILPILLTIFGYQYIYKILNGALMTNMFELKSVFPLTTQISLTLLLIGVVVGLSGSFFSTTKYLRWKR